MSSYRAFGRSVVIFGAGGFIGAVMASMLEEAGFQVTRIASREANLGDEAQVRDLRRLMPPGAAWVLAAARSPDYPGEPVALKEENLRIAQNVALLAELAPPAGLVLLSSIDVYGRAGLSLPLSEQSPRNPQTPYAESKCETEDLLTGQCGTMDVPLLTLRLPGIYGPGDTHSGPVRSFIDAALQGNVIQVMGDGLQRRDLLYVKDLARIVARWMDTMEPGLYNAVTGRSVTLLEILQVISECAGRPLTVVHDRDAPQIDIEFSRPRLLRALPGLQLTRMEAGVRETWERMRGHVEGVAAHAN